MCPDRNGRHVTVARTAAMSMLLATVIAALAWTGVFTPQATAHPVATSAKLTIPAGCPARFAGEVPATDWPPARRRLVPAGALSIRVCRYNGDNAGLTTPTHAQNVLLGEARIAKHNTVARLVDQFNGLGQDHPPHSCPDENVGLLVLVTYPGDHRLDVGVDSCLLVSNGSTFPVAWVYSKAGPGLALVTRLVRVSGGGPTTFG